MPSLKVVAPAVVLPASRQPRSAGAWVLDGGVFAADGKPVAEALHRGERVTAAAPTSSPSGDLPARSGTWLFGGWLQPHFGHFVLYSLGRLWAVPQLGTELAGVAFLRLPNSWRQDPLGLGHVRDTLSCLGVGGDVRAEVIDAPTRFERLVVPEQLLFRAGNPPEENAAFLAMLRGMQASPQVPDGLIVPRLYVSRRRLDPSLGGFMFEEVLEDNLMAEGYAVLHPERLPVPQQVAAYAGAREIIFAEGSALHLAVAFLGPDTGAAILCRRPPRSPKPGDLLRAGVTRALLVDAVLGGVVATPGDGVTGPATVTARTLLDLARVRDALTEAGFCRGTGWRLPDEEAIAARIAAEVAARREAAPRMTVRYATRDELLDARRAGRPA